MKIIIRVIEHDTGCIAESNAYGIWRAYRSSIAPFAREAFAQAIQRAAHGHRSTTGIWAGSIGSGRKYHKLEIHRVD